MSDTNFKLRSVTAARDMGETDPFRVSFSFTPKNNNPSKVLYASTGFYEGMPLQQAVYVLRKFADVIEDGRLQMIEDDDN